MIEYFASLGFFGWAEILAMITGFFYVFLEIKKSHYLWYFCMASSVFNIFVFWNNHYLAMLILQFYYIGNSFYGLAQFRKVKAEAIVQHGDRDEKDPYKIAIVPFNWKVGGTATALALLVFFILAPIMNRYAVAAGTSTFPGQPYFDTFIAVSSMLNTFFLSRSYICQWYLWILLDTFTIVIFFMSGMYWMSLLYVAYVAISAYGARFWHKHGVYVR